MFSTVGSEIVTPGLINLLFVLLKTQNNSNLNSLAIDTLSIFIKKRFIFGKGILLNLTDLLIANHDVKQKQYIGKYKKNIYILIYIFKKLFCFL